MIPLISFSTPAQTTQFIQHIMQDDQQYQPLQQIRQRIRKQVRRRRLWWNKVEGNNNQREEEPD